MYNIVLSDDGLWTISPTASPSASPFYVSGDDFWAGILDINLAVNSRGVSPVLYLSSDITLIGDGSSSNPFKIS